MEHMHRVGLTHVELAKESRNLRKMSIEFSRARNTCHSPDKMLFGTQKSFQTRLNSPLQRFRSKVLVASDSPLPRVLLYVYNADQQPNLLMTPPNAIPELSLPLPIMTEHLCTPVSTSSKQQPLSTLSTTKRRLWLSQ